MNLRTFIVLSLVVMFAYHVVDIKSNMKGNFARRDAQIETALNQ